MVDGYSVDNIEAPKFVSRGEWAISGDTAVDRYMPLKAADLTSGTWGLSGIYEVVQWAEPYDDISGLSGCIGVTLRNIVAQTDTGQINQNFARRHMAVLHEGFCYMRYESGLLDGSVVTLKWGDKIAPCTSGFRVWEYVTVEGGSPGTGIQQCELGYYADVPSDATGTWKRVRINPSWIRGQTK